jgi:exopolysaccharide production protein ExoZ
VRVALNLGKPLTVAQNEQVMNKISQIQLARAIAALMVVYYHSYMGLRAFNDTSTAPLPFLTQYGFLGVNLFFIVSGFIIGLVTDKPRFSPREFFVKRVFRIYPVFLLFFVLNFLLAKSEHTIFLKVPVSAGAFVENLAILPMKVEPVYAVAWSLEHELIFYLLAMIVVPFARLLGLFVVVVLLGVIGQMVSVDWDYHFLSVHQLEFAAGLAIYMCRERLPKLRIAAPFVIAICCYAAGVYLLIPYVTILGGTAFLIALLNIPSKFVETRLGFMVKIGDASYSLYLGHWLLLGTSAIIAWSLQLPDWYAEPYRAAIIAVSVIVSLFVYRLVEKPVIKFGHRVAVYGDPSIASKGGQNQIRTRTPFPIGVTFAFFALFIALTFIGHSRYREHLAILATPDSKAASQLLNLITEIRDSKIPMHQTPWGNLAVSDLEGKVVIDVEKVSRQECINALIRANSMPMLIIASGSTRGADERRIPISEEDSRTTCRRSLDNTMRFIFADERNQNQPRVADIIN